MCLLQDRSKVRFQRGDACSLPLDVGQFDCVLAANLICRLHTPHAFLDRLPSLVSTGGILVITSPYTFLRHFTPRVCAVLTVSHPHTKVHVLWHYYLWIYVWLFISKVPVTRMVLNAE